MEADCIFMFYDTRLVVQLIYIVADRDEELERQADVLLVVVW